MSSETVYKQPRVGVGVLCWQQQKLLLGKRLSESAKPCWQFPGGHILPGESVFDCAIREVYEETGLTITSCVSAGYGNRSARIAGHDYFTLYVSAQVTAGLLQVREPDKCGGWQWFDISRLPQPLFQPIVNLLEQQPDLSKLRPMGD